MSLELVIFLIVAAVAIFAAAFMLVSRNAVHSALFLVINMICLAFFYLLLNAPFLAMVQITVYAGAIMVLFMFVIMLLGAEQLSETTTRYRWLPVAAVGLTTLFLITAFVAVVQGNVGALKPIPHAPQVRVVNVAPGQPALDVYLNNDKLAGNVAYGANTDYQSVTAGSYNALVFAEKADGSAVDLTKDKPIIAVPLTLAAETVTTLIATPDHLIVAPEDLSTLADDNQFRYQAVNALPGTATANLTRIDPADVKNVQIIAPNLAYGDVTKAVPLTNGLYTLAWQINGQRALSVPEQRITAASSQLFILAAQNAPGSTTLVPTSIQLSGRTAAAFGGPQNIGEQLFSVYLLPFELVSLLLLAAMVGAIILTREEVIKRDRKRVVLTPSLATRRLNTANAAPALSVTVDPTTATSEASTD